MGEHDWTDAGTGDLSLAVMNGLGAWEKPGKAAHDRAVSAHGEVLTRLADAKRVADAGTSERDSCHDLMRQAAHLMGSSWQDPKGSPMFLDTVRAFVADRDRLRTALEEAEWERDAALEREKIVTLKAITCGVIAEGNEDLNSVYSEGGKWDSPQAQRVRAVVAERNTLAARVGRLGGLTAAVDWELVDDMLDAIACSDSAVNAEVRTAQEQLMALFRALGEER